MTQTLTHSEASAIVQRVARQSRLVADSGCSLYEAGWALNVADTESDRKQRERYALSPDLVATLSHQQITEGGITESQAHTYGVKYLRDYGSSQREHAKRHVARLSQSQHAHPLSLLCITQYVDVTESDGTQRTVWFTLGRYGHPVSERRVTSQSRNAKRTAGKPRVAKRKVAGRVQSGAERTANSRWRKVAQSEGWVCPEHGTTYRNCGTTCRHLHLGITEPTQSVELATASDSWDRDSRE